MFFDSPQELAALLYHETVEDDDSPEQRLELLIRCCVRAGRLWERHHAGDGDAVRVGDE